MADWGQKVQESYGPCLWEKVEGEGRGSEDSTGFQQDASSYARTVSDLGNFVVRYLAGDVPLLCSSIGGGLGLPCPSTF